MQVILTHEQADFDAIASLLGAYLIQGNAYAIMPNNLNRNVREFLHLYATELPFIQVSGLPKKAIKTITMVDTQSLATIKGIKKDTHFFSIDHHKKKTDFPETWEFIQVETSACTTYFVEQLIEQNNYHLNLIEATLLLLGIYEDSGSLTYANTTARDASAVSYLLSQGASLKIASEFLNPPLSIDQQAIFNSLMDKAQTITIANKNIFVSYADAPNLGDEVSSIAHKICDLLDPDALFIFVSIGEGIRFVARSETDQIDVSKIAQDFDGGGHQRASAALIKRNKQNSSQLDDLVSNFLSKLHKYVQPAITVEQIMSKKPLTITPGTTIEESRILMQRFGYEGYPVVQEKKILGLLNRRAVDKAYAHNLKKNAASLMEAGDYHVFPNHSLDYLQQIMANSGWGQIPVVDPGSKEVIGIATRTDLLKTLAGNNSASKRKKNLAVEMNKKIPPEQFTLLELISKIASELSTPIFLVGGFVRDLMLDAPSPDLDFVVEGDALELASLLAKRYGGKVTSHKKFSTAKWWPLEIKHGTTHPSLPFSSEQLQTLPQTIDLISARTEFYEKPTALPTVKKGSIKLDLHRRDFTINTMAVRLDGKYFGEVVDHWGGLNDLNQKYIRVLHSLSFVDDPTRMLRAVRFEQRFGFKIETRTLELLNEAVPLLDDVSGDRIRHELDQMIIENNVIAMFSRLNQLGLLNQIHTAIHWDELLEKEFGELIKHEPDSIWLDFLSLENPKRRINGSYTILLQKLSPPDVRSVIKRLRFKSALQKTILAANELWHNQKAFSAMSPGEFCTAYEKLPAFAIYLNWLSAEEPLKKKITKFVHQWRFVQPNVSGDHLKKIGIPPGPIYKRILQKLRVAWINGEIKNVKQEQKLLKEILAKIS